MAKLSHQKVVDLISLPQVDLTNLHKVELEDTRRLYEICAKAPDAWSETEREFINSQAMLYSANQYSKSSYNLGYFDLTPSYLEGLDVSALPNTVQDINTRWDVQKYSTPRLPFSIGKVKETQEYDIPGVIRCLHLPVKLPKSDIRVPREYAQFKEALQKILDFEFTLNPDFENYHAYLTVDQRFVPASHFQRLPGAHVDGLPRDRDTPNGQRIDHSYIITNNLPTVFFNHPFPLGGYDLNKHNFFAVMRFLADESHIVLSNPYEITLMNAYSVHTSMPTEHHLFRTFMRLEFSTLQFDRLGNAVNPYFEYDWSYRECPIPPHLELPEEIKSQLA